VPQLEDAAMAQFFLLFLFPPMARELVALQMIELKAEVKRTTKKQNMSVSNAKFGVFNLVTLLSFGVRKIKMLEIFILVLPNTGV
jgi:hypothetical protein